MIPIYLTSLQFMASRPATPLLLKGKNGASTSRDVDFDVSQQENGGLAIPKPTTAAKSGPDAVSVLEAKVNEA